VQTPIIGGVTFARLLEEAVLPYGVLHAAPSRKSPRKSGLQWTLRWREMDSNHRYRMRNNPFWLPLFGPRNSPSATKTGCFVPGTDGSNPSPSSGESANFRSLPRSIGLHDSGNSVERPAANRKNLFPAPRLRQCNKNST
jgi:hypothetical protein